MEPEGSSPRLQQPATSPHPKSDQSSPCPLRATSWRSILILSSHLSLSLRSGLFPSGWGAHIIKLCIMQSPTAPYYLFHLRPKYPPPPPILKHLQPTFLPHCKQPSFTPFKTTGKVIILYKLIFTYLDSKVEDKTFLLPCRGLKFRAASFLGKTAKIGYYPLHICPYFCLSTRKNLTPTEQIFMKFYNWRFSENLSGNLKFRQYMTRTRYFTQTSMYIRDISLGSS